ncbi:MvdC/MvdD family ATP grasp protein [Streptomyces sp. NPDC058440]|uniref:MvdC/MvdD family ATP grasp protein n=1 Tax=Streptomyces sp. NPDC058440 TaxID=3346501 RepID=UPI00365C01EF
MTDMGPVLVVTNLDNPMTDLVIDELHGRGVPVVRFDSGDFPATLSLAATVTSNGIGGTLSTPTRTADLSRVRSLYYRRPSGFAFPHLDGQTARFAVTQARYGLGGVMASLPGCLYVNHPHRIGDAEFKPSGLAAAAACGFRLPEALRAYLDHFRLVFGAFDFAVDRQGQWWFLECNPSGQWAWLEPETRLPMVVAMADLLERKTA